MKNTFELSHYNYDLPESLIAKYPTEKRVGAKLLVLESNNQIKHTKFSNILDYLETGDTLVLNNTKVFPARIYGKKKKTGGIVETLLSRPAENTDKENQNNKFYWVCLMNSLGKNLLGRELNFYDSSLGPRLSADPAPRDLFASGMTGIVKSKIDNEPGAHLVEFSSCPKEYAKKYGEIPLPTYFERKEENIDKLRYQTVFADNSQELSAAAPTAGLHFDDKLLSQIRNKKINIAYVTLHVGPGTFLPVHSEDIRDHKMHAESWEISQETADILNQTRANNKNIIAVGTTSVRTLESALANNLNNKKFEKSCASTKIFIYPGYKFKAVDKLITNFHLPKSSLLLLISAFAGRDNIMRAYEQAIENNYRFFSYGDACLFEKL